MSEQPLTKREKQERALELARERALARENLAMRSELEAMRREGTHKRYVKREVVPKRDALVGEMTRPKGTSLPREFICKECGWRCDLCSPDLSRHMRECIAGYIGEERVDAKGRVSYAGWRKARKPSRCVGTRVKPREHYRPATLDVVRDLPGRNSEPGVAWHVFPNARSSKSDAAHGTVYTIVLDTGEMVRAHDMRGYAHSGLESMARLALTEALRRFIR